MQGPRGMLARHGYIAGHLYRRPSRAAREVVADRTGISPATLDEEAVRTGSTPSSIGSEGLRV